LPHEALEYIRDKDKEAFDPEFVNLFLSNIAPFPIGSTVLLNNNEKVRPNNYFYHKRYEFDLYSSVMYPKKLNQ